MDLRAEEGEIQTAILIPKASYDRTFGHYIKYAMRNAMDIATLGTSVNARLSPDKKTFERVRIAFGVAGPVPLRALNAGGLHQRQGSHPGEHSSSSAAGGAGGYPSPGFLAGQQGFPDATSPWKAPSAA